MLVFEVLEVVLRVLALVRHGKEGGAKRCALVEVGVVVLADVQRLSEVLLELSLGLGVVDREVMVFLGVLLVARSHSA